MLFADFLNYAMEQSGISNYKLAKDIGVSQTTVANWLNGTTEPRERRRAEVLNLFDVDEYDLDMGFPEIHYKRKNALAFTKKDERDIEKKLADVLDELENGQDGLMFSGEAIDDTTRELLADSLRNSMEMGKMLAKQKFTPKKYRKDE